MKSILFVEDNVILLQMYGMMLDRERAHWKTVLAADAQQALELMKQSAFDVIVSDLRMPGMGGVELLEEVRRLYPQTSRVIVSGIGDQEEIARALNSTHQFLTKPVEVKNLKATLARIGGLDAYLKDGKLKALVGRMRSLPSFPSLYLEIMKEINSPNSAIQSIAEIVTTDPSLTAKMLQVVNSAAFGLPHKIHDPFEAVQQLGMNTVRSLALSAHVFERFENTRIKGFDVTTLWDHLMKTGQRAQKIVRQERADPADAEDACTAGMLHDMGKLMLAENLPGEFQSALALAAERNIPAAQAELEVFGATHAGVAAYLLGLWGLPAPVVEAVAFHHAPSEGPLQQFGPLTAVHVANALEHESSNGRNTVQASGLDANYLTALGLEERVNVWREETASQETELAVG